MSDVTDGAVDAEAFGRDAEGRFNPHVLAHQIARFGRAWADAKAAAELLEKTEKTLVARLTNQERARDAELSRREAEDLARGSDGYGAHVARMVEARRLSDTARARYDAVRALAEGLRTAEATRRAEMTSFHR